MRIAMLIPSLGGGGAERIALELACGLNRKGHQTDLFLLERLRSYDLPEGVETRHIQEWGKTAPTLLKGLSLPGAHRKLDQALRAGQYDVVVSHMERCNGLLLMRPGNIPGLLVAHNFLGTSLSAKNFIKRLYGGLIYYGAAKRGLPVAFVAEAARQDALQRFPLRRENTASLPNFIDVGAVASESCRALPKEWEDTFSGPVIITAGRLARQKGQWHLVRAFSKVAQAIPDARLVIFGEGEMRCRLKGLALSLGLHKRVLFPGFSPDIFPFLRKASAFALTSLNEGMPMILLEALACGCAIVSADCPSGPREVLAPGTPLDTVSTAVEEHAAGLLTPRFDGVWRNAAERLTHQEELFADALLAVITDKPVNQRLRAGAENRAIDFSRESGVEFWLTVLEKVAKREYINE